MFPNDFEFFSGPPVFESFSGGIGGKMVFCPNLDGDGVLAGDDALPGESLESSDLLVDAVSVTIPVF